MAVVLAFGTLGGFGAGEVQANADGAGGTVVKTTNGLVRGASQTLYTEWLGLPYAAPPVGALRWKAPQPGPTWPGTRDATRFGNRCVQGTGWDPGYETPKLTEDCLYLNVYRPHNARPNAPVLFWIHGGGFVGGAGQDTDPRKFIAQGQVVFVTINYRLGGLGFLDLPQLTGEGANGPGNYGLLDQQAALRWVHANITRFGGNPNDVTIAGQSAGGMSVCDHLASPTAHGLFQRAVIMSGGCAMQSQAGGYQSGRAFAAAVGCTDAATLLACLRGKSPAEILAAQQQAGVGPAVGGSAFPLDPATSIATGAINRVPVMNGGTHDEARLFVFGAYDATGHPVTAALYEASIRQTFGANADRVLREYPVSAYPSPSLALATVWSDAGTRPAWSPSFMVGAYPRYQIDRQLSRYVPTYSYEFNEVNTPQFASIFRLQWAGEPARSFPFGATHVDDLPYLWDYLGQTLPFTDDQLELSNQMIRYWARFTAAGNPNAPHVPDWPQYRASTDLRMSLKACATGPASDQPPAACSAVSANYSADHKIAFWASILG
jgi:para-nitrobenzyl esterase